MDDCDNNVRFTLSDDTVNHPTMKYVYIATYSTK